MAAIGCIAAVWLVVIGVRLISDINGSACQGQVPFCTTPTQQSARHVFAEICGVGVLAYLLAMVPALKARRFGFATAIVVGVVLLALAALVANPVHHLDGHSANQWFLDSWPLSPN